MMKEMLEDKIRKSIHFLGWDLYRLSPANNSMCQTVKILERANIGLVFDIGANEGQFAKSLRCHGYSGLIVSFEPLSTPHGAAKKAAARDSKWIIHPRCAIGERVGEVGINIAGNLLSSSILPMLDTHSSAEPNSAYVGTEQAPMERLDDVAFKYVSQDVGYFIKIDAQGYEWSVLDGAEATLRQARGVLCELSLVPLYEGQHLWRDIVDRLESLGYALWAIQRGFTDPRDGRALQVDGIFMRQ